jgi:SM-20-related protein
MIDPRHSQNIDSLNACFLADGLLLCPEFLEHSAADALFNCFAQDIDWSTFLLEDGRWLEWTSEQQRGLTDEQHADFASRVCEAATRGMCFYYDSNRRSPAQRETQVSAVAARRPAFGQLFEFLNSPPGLQFFRRLTSIDTLSRVSAQASRFRAGQFLTIHDDEDPGRKIAYVINLTPSWNPSWGGQLRLLNRDGRVLKSFSPQFNTLHLFSVPQRHCVSLISPFALHARYAVSGWLHIS